MKKTAILLAALLAFGLLSACGGTPDDSASDEVSSSSQGKEDISSSEEKKASSRFDSSSQSDSSSGSAASSVEETDWNDDGILKILTIGNSFSDDSMEYVAQIALSAGVKSVKLGNLYIGGCTLATHATNARSDAAAYEYRVNSGTGWSTTNGYKMSDAIQSENWDYISLQQASGSSGVAQTYSSSLQYLIDYVKEIADENAKLVWNMTWAYQQNSTHGEFSKYENNQTIMYEAIVNAVKTEVEARSEISLIIPTGTAIQNARSSYVGDTLTRDGYHLSMDFGRYIAGMTFVRKLTGLSVDDLEFAPSGVDENYQRIAAESANNAVESPYAVTPSVYKEEPAFDYSQYDALDLGLTQFAYWNSADGNWFNKLVTDASNSPCFFATKRFTRIDIPVGSVIELASGWQYRPEGWKDDAVQATRPGNVSVKRIEVTEEWWGDYIYRAFNISKSGTPSLVGSEDAAAAALKIYVPKDADTGYTLLDFEKIEFAFWDSSDKTNYNRAIADNASLSEKFFTTKRFSPEELPVGSIIKLENGWQYRPDAWKDDSPQSSRPGNVTAEQTVITAEWWGDYIYRAFNVAKIGLPSLKGVDTEGVLKIYVPKKS